MHRNPNTRALKSTTNPGPEPASSDRPIPAAGHFRGSRRMSFRRSHFGVQEQSSQLAGKEVKRQGPHWRMPVQANGPLVRKNTRVSWCVPMVTRSIRILPERPSARASVYNSSTVGRSVPSLRMNDPLYPIGSASKPIGSKESNATVARSSSPWLILPIASDMGGARCLPGTLRRILSYPHPVANL
jgi:hypothetical protein